MELGGVFFNVKYHYKHFYSLINETLVLTVRVMLNNNLVEKLNLSVSKWFKSKILLNTLYLIVCLQISMKTA